MKEWRTSKVNKQNGRLLFTFQPACGGGLFTICLRREICGTKTAILSITCLCFTIKHFQILTYLLIYYYCTCIVFIGILSVSDVSLLMMAKVCSRNVECDNKECNKNVYLESCIFNSHLHWNIKISERTIHQCNYEKILVLRNNMKITAKSWFYS